VKDVLLYFHGGNAGQAPLREAEGDFQLVLLDHTEAALDHFIKIET
jgi:hypothetical protein